jgi:very-short-patch-repair endonuclease
MPVGNTFGNIRNANDSEWEHSGRSATRRCAAERVVVKVSKNLHMPEVDVTTLRDLLYGPLISGTHSDITKRFHALGLSEPCTDGSATKAVRVHSTLASMSVEELRRVADAVLSGGGLGPELRNQIQDVLWDGQGPVIWERTRRKLATALSMDDLVVDSARFEAMLDRWWILGTPNPFEGIFTESDTSTLAWAFGPSISAHLLREQIQRHVFNNPGDWSAEKLFDELGAFDAVDRRFAGLLEDLVSHQVVIDEDTQRRLVAAMASPLREAGLELRETGLDGGYPVFRLISAGAPTARPKNVIFGSARKPDLRISDTVNNELEIVDDRGNLVFDDPIGLTGLRWQDLQAWWQRQHPDLDVDAAKITLYKRLRDALPDDSPPQRRLFELYHRINRHQIPSLPALLPEVWLHWDYKTVQQRGVQALLGQRMDFLLLAPNHHRIILEVDGASHYTDEQGRPSATRYARNARFDRDMQLRGYTVYRFGAGELQSDKHAMPMLAEFCRVMFARHGISG